MIAALLAALLAAGTAPDRGAPDPDVATTAARRARGPPEDAELLRNLELLEKLDLLQNLDLFDEGR